MRPRSLEQRVAESAVEVHATITACCWISLQASTVEIKRKAMKPTVEDRKVKLTRPPWLKQHVAEPHNQHICWQSSRGDEARNRRSICEVHATTVARTASGCTS